MTNMKTFYIFLASFFLSLFLHAQLGINVTNPESIFHVVDNSTTAQNIGITLPNVKKFTAAPLDDSHTGLLVYYNNDGNLNTGKEGFYFYDNDDESWQYIFKVGSEKENLFKTTVKSPGIEIPGSAIMNTWYMMDIDFLDTPNPGYLIIDGKLRIAKKGKYAVFYSGSATKTNLDNSVARVESGLFKGESSTPLIYASNTIPASDNYARSITLNFSAIIELEVDDILSLKVRKVNNYSFPILFNDNDHYLILTYID